MDVIHTIGRRKTSVARVFMSKGKGDVIINNKKLSEYFTTDNLCLLYTSDAADE